MIVELTGHMDSVSDVCADILLAFAQFEGGAEAMIECIVSNIEDSDKIYYKTLIGWRRGEVHEQLLLVPIFNSLRPTIRASAKPDDIRTWCFSVLCEYYMYWISWLRVHGAELPPVFRVGETLACIATEVPFIIPREFKRSAVKRMSVIDALQRVKDTAKDFLAPVHEMQIPPFDPAWLRPASD